MQRYDSKSITTQEVCTEIERLFTNYPALFRSFNAFLPSREDINVEETISKRLKLSSPQLFTGFLSSPKYIIEELSDVYVRNETQFFHRLRTILNLNSPRKFDYYNEFARCLDLYSTCIITKSELVALVSPLFEPSDVTVFINPAYISIKPTLQISDYSDLRQCVEKQLQSVFEAFKALISTREVTRRKTGWFFQPLSDLEITGLRRHGHSYIMPTRPKTTCTSKLKDGITYLNNQWVSVPYGSEDFSFLHMRKNPYEDALFKVEDERFDSDLAIEQIKFTLNILSDEYAKLAKLPIDQQREFRLDKRIFTPIRLKPIYNIYGDHGQKFAELLEQEPIRALPVIIGRLKSKLEAWLTTAKIEKERAWKDTAEKNFSKSLDHRSFYFKQIEKKAANHKSFLTEAKARYEHRFQSHQKFHHFLSTHQSDSDYEFLGGSKNRYFYSSFVGVSYGVPHCVPANYSDELITQGEKFPPQTWKPAYANGRETARLPQFRLLFSCQTALDDALRLMLFALDKNPPLAKDKVKQWLKALYQDFLSSPIPADIKSGNLDEVFGPLELEDTGTTTYADEQKKILKRWISGDEGDVEASESEDELSNSVGEPGVETMCLHRDVPFTGFLPLLEHAQVMYAPVSIYTFFRFLYSVYERLIKVKQILALEYEHSDMHRQSSPLLQGYAYKYSDKVESEYKNFLRTVCTVLRGTCDSVRYEERCRQILAQDSYILFSFDKLLANTIKSMTVIAMDDMAKKAFGLYSKYRRIQQANEEMYLAEFSYLAKNTQGPSFRLHCDLTTRVLSVTYLENPYEKLQSNMTASSIAYFHSFTDPPSSSCALQKELRPFLKKLDQFYVNNALGEQTFARSLQVTQRIKAGLTEGSARLRFIPGGEDSLFNTQFQRMGKVMSYVPRENCVYAFTHKKHFLQKMTELGETAFSAWHKRWLSASH